MARLVFGMNVSLDGYVDHDKFAPGPALFQHFIEQTDSLAGSVYGRGLYELMQYWDGDAWSEDIGIETAQLRAFAQAWRRQPKWVVSRTLARVGPNATLLGEDFAAAIAALKARLDGRIDVGGPKLAASLGKLGLIDEYQLYVRPCALGGGAPYFAGFKPALRLIASDRIGEDTVRLTYAPA